jgi:hypothetical protein
LANRRSGEAWRDLRHKARHLVRDLEVGLESDGDVEDHFGDAGGSTLFQRVDPSQAAIPHPTRLSLPAAPRPSTLN